MSQVLFLGLSGGKYRDHKDHRTICDVRGEKVVDLINGNNPSACRVVPGADEEEGAGGRGAREPGFRSLSSSSHHKGSIDKSHVECV